MGWNTKPMPSRESYLKWKKKKDQFRFIATVVKSRKIQVIAGDFESESKALNAEIEKGEIITAVQKSLF